MEDPSDEMLAYIMREAAEDARKSNEDALKKYFGEIAEMYKKYGDKKCPWKKPVLCPELGVEIEKYLFSQPNKKTVLFLNDWKWMGGNF